MKIKKIFLTLILTFILCVPSAFAAHECYYSYKKDGKTADVTIVYEDDKVTVKNPRSEEYFKGFRKFWNYFALVVDYERIESSSPLLTKSLEYAVENDACPGGEEEVFVCSGVVTSTGVIFRQLSAAGESLADLVNWMWEDLDGFGEWILTLLDDLADITEVVDIKEILIVSGSKADAEKSYGYSDGGAFEINWDGFYKKDEDFDASWYSWSDMTCDSAYYIGDKVTFNMNCPYLAGLWSDFENKIYDYADCSSDISCETKTLNSINNSEDKLKKYCSSVLENQDYYLNGKGDKDDKINVCIPECLSIKDKATTLKLKVGIITEDKGDCGFSSRLLIWLRNIFKWIKYILPVVVIILGILDFIKAIGSDKEDEMKKAQKQFIIRLIAAALVFIVPLILEFVIGKMGFIYEDCGIIYK